MYKIENKPRIPVLYYSIPLSVFVISVLSSNPILTFESLIALPILLKLTYRKGFTAVFAFMVTWQWMEITIKVFYADLLYIPVAQLVDTNSFNESVTFSLLGLLALAAGIFLVTKDTVPVKV